MALWVIRSKGIAYTFRLWAGELAIEALAELEHRRAVGD